MDRTDIQERLAQTDGMACFGCGPAERNPHGLQLVFEETPEGARTKFSLPRQFESYPGFLHGGVLCAVLDETMAYVAVLKHHVLPFTRKMEIEFRGAVPGGVECVCEARWVERTEGGYWAEGWILDPRGRKVLRGRGRFALPDVKLGGRLMAGVSEKLKPYLRPS